MTRISLTFILLLSLIQSSCRQNTQEDLGGYNQAKVDSAEIDAIADIRNGDIHIIAYGTPDIFVTDLIDSLAKQNGFYYKNGGCVINVTSEAYSEIYNKKVIDHLSKKNGTNWFDRFEILADSLVDDYYNKLQIAKKK